MAGTGGNRESGYLLVVESGARLSEVEAALRRAGIPCDVALIADGSGRVVVSVPSSRVDDARWALSAIADPGAWIGESEPSRETEEPEPRQEAFPRRAAWIAAVVVVVHLAIVLAARIWPAAGASIVSGGALVSGATSEQPWRLVTHLAIHSGFRHALSNGLGLVVFAVPLLAELGVLRAATVYLLSGIGGAAAALALAAPGTWIVGSSGAVAGVFGAWIVHAVARARHADLPRRARLRAMGIALLVLPALLNPMTPEGGRISVESHVGGLATGMAIGAVLSRRFYRLRSLSR